MNRRRDSSPDYSQRMVTVAAFEQLAQVLKTLTPRESGFITMYYGLHDGVSTPIEEIAQYFGVSVRHIRKVEESALAKLRHPAWGTALNASIEDLLESRKAAHIPDHIKKRIFPPVHTTPTVKVHCDRHGWSIQRVTLTGRCESCPCVVETPTRGRPRRFCTDACRQAAYRRRSPRAP